MPVGQDNKLSSFMQVYQTLCHFYLEFMHVQGEENKDRPTVELTAAKAQKYKQEVTEFEKIWQEEQAAFNTSPETTYYIVSVKFIKSWRGFCRSTELKRHLPIEMNSDLIDPDTKQLKKDLKEKEDFEIVTPLVYQKFSRFTANELRRKAVMVGYEKRVPIYLNKYKYIMIKNSDLKDIDRKLKRRNDFQLSDIGESQHATVEDFTRRIQEGVSSGKYYEFRLWRVAQKESMDSLFDYLKKAADRANYEYRIKGFGKLLKSQVKIEDLMMDEGDFFVVEAKEKGRKWFLQAENEKKCEGCYDIAELKFSCKCEKVAYCSQSCMERDRRFHLRTCEWAEMEELNKPVNMTMASNSKKGRVGLRNIGNTCFMNSCLQCLSNTVPLSQYFLNMYFEPQINRTNVLGTKGKLAKSYAKFIKATWCDFDDVITPDNLKSAVSSINPMFSGYQQHDSQEFFSFLVDGLHEDLNRVEKKPYVQSVQSNSRPDNVVALESWIAHIKRNQSIITDLMTGQYKSRVTCPDCKKESITFDPFITVTLPIPQKVFSIFDCFVIHRNFEQKTKRINFSYGKPNVDEWTRKIADIMKMEASSIRIYLVSISEGIYLAGRESISEIIYKSQNESKNIFVVQLTEEEMGMRERVELTGRFSKKGYYSSEYDNMWFKFPFFFEREQANGLAIYIRVLKLLYNQAYNDSKPRAKLFGGKSYEYYEEVMLKKRPFTLYLRHGRKLERSYGKLQYRYEGEVQIQDQTMLKDLLSRWDEKTCELDIRFSKMGLQDFGFDRLKDFDDESKRIKQSRDQEQGPIDIKECFENMREAEQLQAGNEWYCPCCKEHKQAFKEMNIYKAPKILILHLKRFKQKGLLRKEKNESNVVFPQVLDMNPYLIDSQPMSSYASQARGQGVFIQPKYSGELRISGSSKPIYDLYAVSNHYGGLGGGHYTAYAKSNGQWYDFNDSSVRPCSASSVTGSGAYMLFYMRRDP